MLGVRSVLSQDATLTQQAAALAAINDVALA